MPEQSDHITGTMRLMIRDGKPGVQITDPVGNSLFMDGESASVIDPDGRHLAQLPMHNGRLDVSANVSAEFRESLERIERDQQTALGGSMFRKMIYAGQIATTGVAVDMREGDISALAHAKDAPQRSAAPVAAEPTLAAPVAGSQLEALVKQFREEQAEGQAWSKRFKAEQDELLKSGEKQKSFTEQMDEIEGLSPPSGHEIKAPVTDHKPRIEDILDPSDRARMMDARQKALHASVPDSMYSASSTADNTGHGLSDTGKKQPSSPGTLRV